MFIENRRYLARRIKRIFDFAAVMDGNPQKTPGYASVDVVKGLDFSRAVSAAKGVRALGSVY
jgi:hypothetical protein